MYIGREEETYILAGLFFLLGSLVVILTVLSSRLMPMAWSLTKPSYLRLCLLTRFSGSRENWTPPACLRLQRKELLPPVIVQKKSYRQLEMFHLTLDPLSLLRLCVCISFSILCLSSNLFHVPFAPGREGDWEGKRTAALPDEVLADVVVVGGHCVDDCAV